MGKKILSAYAAMRKHALSLPEAWEDHPWDHCAIKVKKKVFAFLGMLDPNPDELDFSVKLPESGDVLALPFAEPTGYGLGKSGWVTFNCKTKDVPPLDVLRDWIDESYRAIAPKTLARQLDGEASPPKKKALIRKKAAKKKPAKKRAAKKKTRRRE